MARQAAERTELATTREGEGTVIVQVSGLAGQHADKTVYVSVSATLVVVRMRDARPARRDLPPVAQPVIGTVVIDAT